MLGNPRRYLERTNFATNYAFFRDTGTGRPPGCIRGWSPPITGRATAPRPSAYGCRLYDGEGGVLAEWEQAAPAGAGGIAIDSREVRARFGLPAFTGQLFIHAIGAAGHDVVKYALDTYGTVRRAQPLLHPRRQCLAERPLCRHARAARRASGWCCGCRTATPRRSRPAPSASTAWAPKTRRRSTARSRATRASRSTSPRCCLGLQWPAQVEVRAGRHVVRPRYEVTGGGRTRIAHLNVERADLEPDPGIKTLHNLLGRGYLLPFPVLPPDRFRSIVLPTPMAESQRSLPLRLDVFAADGRKTAERFLGNLPRRHDLAVDLAELGAEEGHAELVYDFRDGGEADGWMHCLVRYEHHDSGHAAESSFGAHIYNTAMTYRDEPQSYSGPPPGLSTRLFLKLGDRTRRSFAALIYAASAPWHAQSATSLLLHDGDGTQIAERPLRIACSGSAMVFPHAVFGETLIEQAGPRGYVLIRDTTCRLFGYHGLMETGGAFSLDHMFGF